MVLNALMDPVGFIADVIAICNALGFKTPAQREESNLLMREIEAIHDGAVGLDLQVSRSEEKIENAIDTAAVIEIRSRLTNLSIDEKVLDSMIKLLLILKKVTKLVTFAVIIRYNIGSRPATLGMAGSTTDDIHEMAISLDRLARSVKSCKASKRSMTAFIGCRCRGKHDIDAESVVSAALCCLVTEILGLPSVGSAENIASSELEAAEDKTVVLLRPEPVERDTPEYDRLCRIFLVGDTRTGKSSLGNALTQTSTFKVSKGMTGTLHIGSQDILDSSSGYQWLTEVYDTPGLNDKDGLDVYYQAAVEDKIVALQEANALVLTIAVDAGITNATRGAIEEYKALFGEKMVSMLIVVLTTNDPADKPKCEDLIEFNWDTLAGLVEGIRKTNVMCVSLEDLRSQEASYSHTVVQELLAKCQNMPLRIILSLSFKYNKIRTTLLEKRGEVRAEVEEMIKDGWIAYDELTESFASAPDTIIADRFMKGFVYKRTSRAKKAAAIFTGGMLNLIRKFAVHVDFTEPTGPEVWKDLSQNFKHSPDSMRIFGEKLEKKGLAVLVKAGRPTICGTLWVQRSYVTVFNPEYRARHIISSFVEELGKEEEDIAPQVIERLKSLSFPKVKTSRIRRRRSRRDA